MEIPSFEETRDKIDDIADSEKMKAINDEINFMTERLKTTTNDFDYFSKEVTRTIEYLHKQRLTDPNLIAAVQLIEEYFTARHDIVEQEKRKKRKVSSYLNTSAVKKARITDHLSQDPDNNEEQELFGTNNGNDDDDDDDDDGNQWLHFDIIINSFTF